MDKNRFGLPLLAALTLTAFMSSAQATVLGLYGDYTPSDPGGRMILTGPDLDFHAVRGGSGAGGNSYDFMLNIFDWATDGMTFGGGGASMAGIGGNFGNRAWDTLFSSGDRSGSIDRISEASFNGLTPTQLRDSYDILMFTWNSSTTLDGDWLTRIEPYLALGGVVLWEDEKNVGDLAPAVTGSENNGSFGSSYELANIPGLTDGIVGNFVNHHMDVTAWDDWLHPLSGTPGEDLEDHTHIPEPGSVLLLGIGLLGLSVSRKRRLLQQSIE